MAGVSVVGIFYDNGETQGLRGVFRRLEEAHIDYRVLVMATSALRVADYGYSEDKIIRVKELEVVDPKTWGREDSIDGSTVQAVAKKIAELKPQTVITGAVSKVQWQLSEAIEAKKKFAYYDNPNLKICDHPCQATLERFDVIGYHMLVSSEPIAKALKGKYHTAVGHPGIDALKEEVAAVSPDQVYAKLGIPKGSPVITYIGGYGEGYNYETDFKHFVSSVEKLLEMSEWQDLHVVIQTHPKYKDIPESELFEKKFVSHQRMIFSQGNHVTTPEALSIAKLALSQISTVIPQAACAGISAHFMNTVNEKNAMVEAGVSRVLQSHEEIEALLRETARPESDKFYEQAGIPRSATDNLFKILVP